MSASPAAPPAVPPTAPPAANFVAEVPRGRSALLAAACLALAAFGGVLAQRPGPLSPIGWVVLTLFGLLAAAAVRRLFGSGPLLRIDGAGVRWQGWSDATIPWDAIDRAAVRHVRAAPLLCPWLADPARYPPRRSFGRFAAANRDAGFGDLALGTAGTGRRFDELVAAVAAHRPVER